MTASRPGNIDSRALLHRKHSHTWPLAILGAIFLLMAHPAGGLAFDYGGTSGGPLAGSLTVSVVDGLDGTPVPDAWVMVGFEVGDPFADNYGQTGPGGQIVFTDGSLSGFQTVTAAKDGYRVITIIDVDANQVTLPLELFTAYDPADPPVDTGVFVEGVVTNMGNMSNTDINIDMVIVRDPLDLDWVMDFDMNDLFGPAEVEYLTPAGYEGNYDLPRNVYMPSQSISGSPAGAIHRTPYMLRLPEGSSQQVFSMKGRVTLLTLLEVLGSGSIGTLMGAMTYQRFGLDDPLTVTGPGPITRDVNLDYIFAFWNLWFDVSNLPSEPYGWGGAYTKRPFLLPLADIDGLDGTGRIVPMNLELKASSWTGANEPVMIPNKNLIGGNLIPTNFLGMMAVTAFDSSDNPVPRVGQSVLFHRTPVVSGNHMTFNDFYPFINGTGTTVLQDRILVPYWSWDTPSGDPPSGLDFIRCDLDLVAEVDCVPDVYPDPGECPVGRVREYRDTNWTVLLPGAGTRTGFYLPALPPGAPRALYIPDDEPGINFTLDWKLSAYGLYHDGYAFDYDDYTFSDYPGAVDRVTQRSTWITSIPNRAPEPPVNESPYDGETGLSLTPTLAGSLFNDQDADSTHAASQWQVTDTSGDYGSPVYDSGTDAVNLETAVVPNGLLGPGQYYWHVRYQDDGTKWSYYSDETTFTTAGCTGDEDCDDDLFCNGAETCVDNVCQAGTDPCPDDGLYCNGTESCDEGGDQ